jgi:predicted transcriptional regulator
MQHKENFLIMPIGSKFSIEKFEIWIVYTTMLSAKKSYQYHHQENSSCQLSYQNQHQKNVECQLGY